MNYAIILAGGTGQRMRQSGMPKQFLDVYGKPIIVYTLEVFQACDLIDKIIVPCNKEWISQLQYLVAKYQISKVKSVIAGGQDRMESVHAGLNAVVSSTTSENDIVVIHDGVRPLVQMETIEQNVEAAQQYGNAMTVHANVETVVVTKTKEAQWDDFKNREHTYTLTSPQSFKVKELISVMEQSQASETNHGMPLLDTSLIYARLGKKVHLVIEKGNNLKITTPEDYYYLKAYLELQESRHILGV